MSASDTFRDLARSSGSIGGIDWGVPTVEATAEGIAEGVAERVDVSAGVESAMMDVQLIRCFTVSIK